MFSKRILLSVRKSNYIIDAAKPSFFATKTEATAKSSSILWKGAALGAFVGATYSIYSHYAINEKKNKPKPQDAVRPTILTSLPNFKVTRQIKNLGKESELNIVLFQYQSCPFCSKVRAFLNANGITYSVVEVDSMTRNAIKWSEYKKVPTLLVKTKNGYVQLTDSSAAISILSSYFLDKKQSLEEIMNYYPVLNFVDDNGTRKNEIFNKYFVMFNEKDTFIKEQIEKERRWRRWTDEVLMHTICPNIYRSIDESAKTLNFFADIGEWRDIFGNAQSWIMIHGGTYAMWLLGKIIKRKYKYEDDVRKPLYAACREWTQEISKTGGPYMGGAKPDLSDLAVYGLLNCIEGSDAFKDVLSNTNIKPWFYSMKKHIISQNTITN